MPFRFLVRISLLGFSSALSAWAQNGQAPAAPGTPPKVLLVAHEELKPGKESAYAKLAAAIVRGYSRAKIPVYWLALPAVTGSPEVLYLDAFSSFDEAEKTGVTLSAALAAHPDLAQMQDRPLGFVTSEKTVIALRRDDLGYRPGAIDLSKARYLRINVFHLRPGYEAEFAEAAKIAGAAYEKVNANAPWVVYQVNAGTEGPTFLVFQPMRALKDVDDAILRAKAVQDAEGEAGGQRLQQISREAFASTASHIYAMNPAMSHVSADFAAGDPDFWRPKPAPPPKTAAGKNPPAKNAATVQKQ